MEGEVNEGVSAVGLKRAKGSISMEGSPRPAARRDGESLALRQLVVLPQAVNTIFCPAVPR